MEIKQLCFMVLLPLIGICIEASTHGHGQREVLPDTLIAAAKNDRELNPDIEIENIVQKIEKSKDSQTNNNNNQDENINTDGFEETYQANPKFGYKYKEQIHPKIKIDALADNPPQEQDFILDDPIYQPNEDMDSDQKEMFVSKDGLESVEADKPEEEEDVVKPHRGGDKIPEELLNQKPIEVNELQHEEVTGHDMPTPAYLQSGRHNNKLHDIKKAASMTDIYFLAVVAACSVAGLIGLVVAGVCWYRLQKNVKAASEAEYPAYGVTGPTKDRVGSPGDRKLAQSAQMYHYQHQKQQMIALEKAHSEMKNDGSDEDSEEENEEGDYTVYECPGLAPTGEMEVKNPLFSDDTPTPAGDAPPKK